MRTKNIGNTKLTYPESTVWLGDNILLKLQTMLASGPVGGKVTIRNAATGMSLVQAYLTEMKNLVFDIRDSLNSLYTDNLTFNITVDVYDDNFQIYGKSYSFSLTTLDGKSIPGRKHGSARTIYLYGPSDLIKVGLYFNNTGILIINGHQFNVNKTGFNQFDLSSVITDTGIYQACFDSVVKPGIPTAVIAGIEGITDKSVVVRIEATTGKEDVKTAGKGGRLWNKDIFNFDDYCINFVYEEPCEDFDFFKVRYKDTDGIMRYLGGRVINDKTAAEGENYYRPSIEYTYRNLSRKHIKETSGTVKVFYSMLRRDSYWNDILLAEKIEFLDTNNNWLPCSLMTNSVEVNHNESQDVTLEYQLYKS